MSARSAARRARTALTTADHHAPGILLDPAVAAGGIEVVAAPRERQQPAVEGDQAGLDLGRPEVEPEDRLRAGGHARAAGGACRRCRVERDDGFGGRDVGDQRPDDARPQRPEDRADLVLAGRDADRHRKAAEPARIECDDPLAQGRADEPPIEVERGDEDLADGLGRVQVVLRGVAERCDAPGRPADPEQRDIDPLPEVDDRADPGVRDERPLRGRVVDETGRHQPARLATERVGDAPVRLAFRAGRPVAAAQRHDRDRDGRGGLLEGGGGRGHRRPVADTDDRARPERAAQDLGRQPADHPAGEVLGTGDGRGEMDGVEAEGPAQRVAGRALDGRAVDDPDLDDPLGPGALEQARHLWPRDAELLGDRVLRLAELVVEAARPDELLQVAHRAALHVCT